MAVQAFRAALPPRSLYRFPVLFTLLIFLLADGCAAPAPKTAVGAPDALAPVREAALPIQGSERDYDPLMEMIGDSRIVLLGDATHGTHEFYRERARITERLIREKGFDAVAIEGDWQDAARVNRYVRGLGVDPSATAALGGFHDFPGWMWANAEVRDLIEWMRRENASRLASKRAGFYGLDLYGVVDSSDALVAGLERLDPAAARNARKRFGCFSR